MARTERDGVRLAYAVSGNQGRPIVLVHGITESSATWARLAADLARDHRVLVVDLRGHGASDRAAPYDPMTFAEDLHAAVVAAGFDLSSCLVIGHSLGGLVATVYAGMFPCAAVINVDQPLALAGFQDGLRALEPLLRGSEDEFRQAVDMVFGAMAGRLPAEEVDRLGAIRRPEPDVVLGVWSTVLDATPEELDAQVAELLDGVEVPYLALHGIDPGVEYDAWLKARIRGASVEVWADYGHYPHLVDPERFLARVRRFLLRLP
jgi:pimeloyl-ACP methyl ester carboxylesterase